MNAAVKSFASEAGHWYDRDGNPCYEMVGANGKQRPVTLRDARNLGLFPSVTGIIKCAAAPGLEHWKRQQILLSAMTLPRIEGESIDDFANRVQQDSETQGRDARERGTRIHGEIECLLKGGQIPFDEFAGPVRDYLYKRFPNAQWHAERSFASPLGYGGKLDLYAPGIVIDFKTKDFGPEDEVKGYDEHIMQLVACAHGLGEPLAQVTLLNLFVSTREPGLIVAIEWPDYEDRSRAFDMFCHLLGYWKAQKRV